MHFNQSCIYNCKIQSAAGPHILYSFCHTAVPSNISLTPKLEQKDTVIANDHLSSARD